MTLVVRGVAPVVSMIRTSVNALTLDCAVAEFTSATRSRDTVRPVMKTTSFYRSAARR
jgi:hypothetical protein